MNARGSLWSFGPCFDRKEEGRAWPGLQARLQVRVVRRKALPGAQQRIIVQVQNLILVYLVRQGPELLVREVAGEDRAPRVGRAACAQYLGFGFRVWV